MWKRYGFFVYPGELTKVIRAGKAKEHLTLSDSTRGGCRVFDVPVPFNDGTEKIVRCLVSPDLATVVTILPLVTKIEHFARTNGADAKRVHKTVARRLVDDVPEEVVTPVEEFEASTTVEQKPVCALGLADKLRAALHR
jgi:hypothetical protein